MRRVFTYYTYKQPHRSFFSIFHLFTWMFLFSLSLSLSRCCCCSLSPLRFHSICYEIRMRRNYVKLGDMFLWNFSTICCHFFYTWNHLVTLFRSECVYSPPSCVYMMFPHLCYSVMGLYFIHLIERRNVIGIKNGPTPLENRLNINAIFHFNILKFHLPTWFVYFFTLPILLIPNSRSKNIKQIC